MGEHRLHRRSRMLLPVKVKVDEQPAIDAVATDVSVGGLFLLDDARIARAGEAEVEVDLDGEHKVHAHARVVRHQEPKKPRGLDIPGVGMAFEGLESDGQRAIMGFLARRAS